MLKRNSASKFWLDNGCTAVGKEKRRYSGSKEPFSSLAGKYKNPRVAILEKARDGCDQSHRDLIESFSDHIKRTCEANHWSTAKINCFDLADVILFRYVHDDVMNQTQKAAVLGISQSAWSQTWEDRAEILEEWIKKPFHELLKT
jgi:hypothetical protein